MSYSIPLVKESRWVSWSADKESFGKFGKPLGLFQTSPEDWFGQKIQAKDALSIQVEEHVSVQDWVERKIQERNEARNKKDFATADKIRQELSEKAIILEDRPDGTTRWKR